MSYRNHPATQAAANHNRRAQQLGVPGVLTSADIRALWEREPSCVGCGVGRGVDHKVRMSAGGPNTPENLQNLCPSCNAAKSQRDRGSLGCRGHGEAGYYLRRGRTLECKQCRREARARYAAKAVAA